MKYQLVKELSTNSLLMKPEEGMHLVFDQVEFPIPIRESYRLELQKDLKEISKTGQEIAMDGLLKYHYNIEKYENQFYLVRDNYVNIGMYPFQADDITRVALALIKILQIVQAYHQQTLCLGGLSLGLLKQADNGEPYLQDPLILNHLRKSLAEEYRIDPPVEVIRGGGWDTKADIFSWGVLAYRLLTGIDPFAANSPEERLDKILKLGAVSIRALKPELSEGLSQLVMGCLQNDPLKRPSLEIILTKLTDLLNSNALTVSEAERLEYQEKADTNRRRYQGKEKFWRWFRRYGIATLITVGIAVAIVASWIGSQPKPLITDKFSPGQVLAAYFEGVRSLNVSLVEETLHHAKNSFSDTVTNLYVINKTQQGMTFSIKDNAKLEYLDLKILPLGETSLQAKYRTSYTLKITLPAEIHYFQRVEEDTLQPIHKVWRITGIKILQSKNWVEKKPDFKVQSPEEQVHQTTPTGIKK